MEKSQVYTKTGDKGFTSLVGGTRVPKHHIRLEAYGTVDELNSCIGMIRSFGIKDEAMVKTIIQIQHKLFDVGAFLATDPTTSDGRKRIQFEESEIEHLEREMDRMDSELPPLTHFILPGGDPASGYCHIARTVCRRAERTINRLADTDKDVNIWVLRYINRLSDYLFVLSRYIAEHFKTGEIKWPGYLFV